MGLEIKCTGVITEYDPKLSFGYIERMGGRKENRSTYFRVTDYFGSREDLTVGQKVEYTLDRDSTFYPKARNIRKLLENEEDPVR